jgi:hypothetical protein
VHAPYTPGRGPLQERIDTALAFHQQTARAAQALVGSAAQRWLADREAALRGVLGALRDNLLTVFIMRMADSSTG